MSAIDLGDVFLLGGRGVDKFEKSWQELLEATQGQLDAAEMTGDTGTGPGSHPAEPCGTSDKRMPHRGALRVVIFGVTGDLARKKLMPAIYDLANRGCCRPVRAGRFARRD